VEALVADRDTPTGAREFCGDEQPHERHEWIDGMIRRDCPGLHFCGAPDHVFEDGRCVACGEKQSRGVSEERIEALERALRVIEIQVYGRPARLLPMDTLSSSPRPIPDGGPTPTEESYDA
jgi:hypothetical protein